jgi:para-aminobenzoate synthetase component I
VESREIAVEADPVALAARLADLDGFTGLIGSGGHPDARWSVLAALPREEVVVAAGTKPGAAQPWERLDALVRGTAVEGGSADGPPGCGVIALLGYDLRIHTERLPDRHEPDRGCPDLLARAFDAAIVVDRREGRVRVTWLVDPGDRGFTEKATERARELERRVQDSGSRRTAWIGPAEASGPVTNTPRADYVRAVERLLELIRAGDVYQVNFSQRIEGPWAGTATSLLERVAERNPAPFGALVRLGPDSWIVSASPERFLRIEGGRVVTRPIKGTIARGRTPSEDEANARALLESRKDRAELAMVIDLLRNDLSRSCRAGSVEVVEPFALETHPTIHHLVATVRGGIAEGRSAVDVVRAAWPGGSISGVPKIRAQQVIDELERARRGPYTGSLGWFGWDGRADLDILIRTIRLERGRAWLHGGGGVTIRSDPEAEWRESLVKVRGLRDALGWEETLE